MTAHEQYETAKKLSRDLGLKDCVCFTIPQYEAHHDQVCREQREICAEAYITTPERATNINFKAIENAPKPTT